MKPRIVPGEINFDQVCSGVFFYVIKHLSKCKKYLSDNLGGKIFGIASTGNINLEGASLRHLFCIACKQLNLDPLNLRISIVSAWNE